MINIISQLSFIPHEPDFVEMFKSKMERDGIYDQHMMGEMFVDGRHSYGYYTRLILNRLSRKTQGPVFTSDSGIKVWRLDDNNFKMKFPGGKMQWFDNKGELHREDGPAVISANGDKSYYIHGKLHRKDGPAIDYVDGWQGFFLDGEAFDVTIPNDKEETKHTFMKDRNKQTRDAINYILKQGDTLIVEFTKKNGEKRKMECTTNAKRIPEDKQPTGSRGDYINDDVVRVYDLDAEGWRSFRVDSVDEYICKKSRG